MAILHAYHRPTTLTDALNLLQRRGVRLAPLAGGALLVPGLETRTLRNIDGVVDIAHLGLDTLHVDGPGLRIGAMVRLAELMAHPVAGTLADGILRRTATCEGPVNLRNQATVGGCVAAAEADSELYAALLALDARVTVQDGDGTRTVPLADFSGPGRGLIIEVRIPRVEGLTGGHARVARTPRDRPIVAAVAVLGHQGERVALCGVASRPLLAGAPLAPPDDCHGSRAYRLAMAGVLEQRAREEAHHGGRPTHQAGGAPA